mmetsp:Transcript_52407/g.136486  ORF Transcript_52407/g.136486 Transcript_52407/m.136486 type:complete len:279 (-) Transcript_52407:193-1029(-)
MAILQREGLDALLQHVVGLRSRRRGLPGIVHVPLQLRHQPAPVLGASGEERLLQQLRAPRRRRQPPHVALQGRGGLPQLLGRELREPLDQLLLELGELDDVHRRTSGGGLPVRRGLRRGSLRGRSRPRGLGRRGGRRAVHHGHREVARGHGRGLQPASLKLGRGSGRIGAKWAGGHGPRRLRCQAAHVCGPEGADRDALVDQAVLHGVDRDPIARRAPRALVLRGVRAVPARVHRCRARLGQRLRASRRPLRRLPAGGGAAVGLAARRRAVRGGPPVS